MRKKDEALTISNPRLLSAAYFGLLAVVAAVVIDALLYAMGVEQLLPTFQAILLDAVLASCFGAIFGERIVHCPNPYRRKTFLWGFTIVLAALPFYALIFLLLFKKHHLQAFEGINFSNLVTMYFFILLYSFLIAGLWIGVAAGFAAVYLRGHLVYDILHSKYEGRKTPHPEERPKKLK